MKIVINARFGGFGLSDAANAAYKARTGVDFDYGLRTDPHLVAIVEEMGAEASGACAGLKVVEIPDDVEWFIEEYDGLEHIAEEHRTWG
ncbi:MAG: hypothetical protein HQ445_02630 [Polaromonas sp.]|nr:hypothetical protein [Polaromonas sp.]